MSSSDWLADRFEANRPHLRSVAYRMLGSAAEADDAVQEAWLRLARSDTDSIENLGGWLTTVVARVCLDMLRSRGSRREAPLDAVPLDAGAGREPALDPEQEALVADSVGAALLVVLDSLNPAERLAFVLHDMFAVPFDEIAEIVGHSPAGARQLASRARRRVQGASGEAGGDVARKREIVGAFLAASRLGDFEALVALLDPDVVLRADRSAVEMAAANAARGAPELSEEVRGPQLVAGVFAGRAAAARVALVDGVPGAAWAPGGRPRAVFVFTIEDERVAGIEIVVDPDRLQALDVVLLGK
jgi:RNA polymerase sigma factor (sigma-70 family)